MTNHFRKHIHTEPVSLRPAAKGAYAAVVGTVEAQTEKPITGRNGDHLQFDVVVGATLRYQADINTQSRDGSQILAYIADETLTPDTDHPPFGAPSYGVYPAPEAKLSYAALGLTDNQFAPVSDTRIESQLEAALGQSTFVALYGLTFDDGGSGGKGIHETHYNPGRAEQDGAVLVYFTQNGQPLRRWFFFRFQGESITNAG